MRRFSLFIVVVVLSNCHNDSVQPIPEVTSLTPETGKAGSIVVISGKNFSTNLSDNKVIFNTATSKITSATKTALTVTVPAGQSSVDVIVSVKKLTALTKLSFTYIQDNPTPGIIQPALLTKTVTNITTATAHSGGQITTIGSLAIKEKGVCWNNQPGPTIQNMKISNTIDNTMFDSDITNLIENTTYYVRAYVITDAGTVYGDEKIFTTPTKITLGKLRDYPITVPDSDQENAVSSFSLLGKGYVCDLNGKFYEYDPVTNKWTQKADLSETIDGRLSFGLGNRGYVGYGGNAVFLLTNVYEYDPVQNKWTKLNNATNRIAWSSPLGSFFVSNNKIYINNGPYDKFMEGVITVGSGINWTEKTAFPNGMTDHSVAFAIGNKTYIGGGISGKTFWLYDLSLNTWTQLKNTPNEIHAKWQQFVLNDKGYYLDNISCWSYDPKQDRWEKQNISSDVCEKTATVFVINNVAYFLLTDGTFYSFNIRE